jgi:hypothetical protein
VYGARRVYYPSERSSHAKTLGFSTLLCGYSAAGTGTKDKITGLMDSTNPKLIVVPSLGDHVVLALSVMLISYAPRVPKPKK